TIIDPTQDSGTLNILTHTDYDFEGRVTMVTDPEGAMTEYFYYDNGRLFQTKRQLTDDPTYAITEYKYDANGNQTEVKDPEGHITKYTSYDDLDRLLTVEDPAGNETTYTYPLCGCGNAADVEDGRGYTTHTEFDKLRRVKYVRTPQDNITTAYVYDKDGRTIQMIGPWKDANQNGTADDADAADISYTEYDKAGRVTRTYVNSHIATEYYYEKNGDKAIQWVKSPIDTTPTYQIFESHYDESNRLKLTVVDPTDGLNEQTKYVYDSLGRRTEVHAAFGTDLVTITYSEYDKANRLTKSRPFVDDDTYATKYEYNQNGQQRFVYDAEGLAANPQYFTEYQYDKAGRTTKIINAKGGNNYTKYAYDKDGNRTKVIYARTPAGSSTLVEVETVYNYYANHLLHTTDYPGFSAQGGTVRNVTTNIYDGNGNLISRNDGNGQTTGYTYDDNNRLLTKDYPAGTPDVSYTYDAESNLLTLIDTNTDTENEYDDLGRLIKVTAKKYSPEKEIEYTYFEDGLRKTMIDPEENLIEYFYDNAKRLDIVKKNNVQVADYDYNALGLRTNLTRGNNSYTENIFDPETRRLTGVFNKKSNNSIISSFEYEHDKVSNRTKMTLAGGEYVDYDYDNIYQLTDETRKNPGGHTIYDIDYTYDEVGNRLTQIKDNAQTDYIYNNANQLTSETTNSVTTTYEFDKNGNQVKKTK
ncbi:MAG: RHS repeat protein, partial [Planctomycetes bacterium]|nr:RHS repeat protein [Planctomycetota bacterium]